MRVLTLALCLCMFAATLPLSACADDEDRTADYSSSKPASAEVEKRVTPSGDTQVRASDNADLNPVDEVRDDFGYGTNEELNEASESAVLEGKSVTTRTTEERRDSVPRVQELGF